MNNLLNRGDGGVNIFIVLLIFIVVAVIIGITVYYFREEIFSTPIPNPIEDGGGDNQVTTGGQDTKGLSNQGSIKLLGTWDTLDQIGKGGILDHKYCDGNIDPSDDFICPDDMND